MTAYAKSQVTMGTAWSATLEVCSAGDGIVSGVGFYPPPNMMPCWLSQPDGCAAAVGISGLGATASLTETGDRAYIGPANTEAPAKPEYIPEGIDWVGMYIKYTLTVSAPGFGNNDTADYAIWVADGWSTPSTDPSLTYVVGDLSIPVAFTVTGIRRACTREMVPPSDRQTMDFSDGEATDTLVADAANTVTATGGNLSVTGSMGYSAGATVTIGSTFWVTYALSLNRAPNAGTVYARIASPSWDISPVPLTYLDLYKPGASGDVPDATRAPGWSRTKTTDNCARVGNDGGIAMWAEGTYTSAATWAGATYAPKLVTWVPHTLNFSEQSGDESDLVWEGAPREWVLTGDTWAFEYKTATGELEWNEYQSSWEREREYQKYASFAMWAQEEGDWRTDNGEDVGTGIDPDTKDRTCAIMLYPLEATSLSGDPYWATDFITYSHETSININDPPGVAARPSSWVGGGGATADTGDNDHWIVSAGETAPYVARSLATRYWLRMNRLADCQDDSWRQHHQDWPIMLKANLPITETLDDPAWWVSVPAEDVTNWANFSYLRVGLTAPKAGTVTLTYQWSVPSVSDPCTTCFEHRFGAEGSWEYTTTHYSASHTFNVVAGTNSVQLDLSCPAEGFFAAGSARRHQITAVRLDLPGSGLAEEWTLTELALTQDNGDDNHDAPGDAGDFTRYLRNWAWIDSQWAGFSARYNGMPACECDAGYNSSADPERYALQAVQHRQHCPDSELTDRLDTAKDLSRLWQEINWQEGFTCDEYPLVENSAHNKDSEGTRMCASLYWFDCKHSDEVGGTIGGVPTCKTLNIVAGVPYEIHFWKHPRGEVDGVATNSNWSQRRRGTSGIVVQSSNDGGAWADGDPLTTDEHGRFHTPPLLEKDFRYRVAGQGTALTVANRQYTFAKGTIPQPGGDAVACFAHPAGLVKYTVGIVNDEIIAYRLDNATANTWVPLPTVDNSGDYDCVGGEHDGRVIHIIARNRSTQALWQWYSSNEGDAWTGPIAL